tara:strand:- start:18263 stop:19060 length:798 start_codon:yes stop_codon:yes gene_type:complete
MRRIKKSNQRIKNDPKTKSVLECDFKIKAIEEEDEGFFIFEGFASTFGNVDSDGDIIHKGAFLESLKKRMPVVLWQHNRQEPIGMPVTLEETDEGLFIRARLPKADTFVSGRVIPQMKVGSITKMSIGFFILEANEEKIDDRWILNITKVDLLEFSLVTFPANDQADVTAFKSLKEVDDAKALRSYLTEELGLSIKERDTLISKVKSLFGSDGPEEIEHLQDEHTSDEAISMEKLDAAILAIKSPQPDVFSTLDKAILEIKKHGK